jgi:KDO2-lipid IV(A) lauroyltransferase
MGNIRAALGASLDELEVNRIARRSLRNFFRACVETSVAVKSSDEQLRNQIPVVGRENIESALTKGKGVLILSAHLGNFFLLGGRLAIEGFPTFVLVNQPRNGRFAQLMDEYQLQVRQKTIHARPRRLALRELQEVLRDNKVVVMIADEYRKGSGIEVTLFDKAVIARRGPVTLALRTGAAIVPAFMVRQPDDSLKVIIEPELELERMARGPKQIRDNTIRITRWLEGTVRAYPDQWNWMNLGRSGLRQNHPVGVSEPVQRTSQQEYERGVE